MDKIRERLSNSNIMTSIFTNKYFRLLRFGLVALLATYLAVNSAMSWVYVFFLTHPPCPLVPQIGTNLPLPEEHLLKTGDGLELRAWYYPSENGAAILALGGLQGSLGGNLPPVGFITEEGYGVLQIDSRACAKPPKPVTLGLEEVKDAEAGLEFMLERPEVDPGRIGVMGFSMGGVTAIRTAARRVEIRAVISEGGYDNLGRDFIEPDQSKPVWQNILLYSIAGSYWLQIGEDPWRVSPIEDLPKISPRPVLLIYGEHEIGNGRGKEQYEAAREPKELWIVPSGSHGKNHLVEEEAYRKRILSFLDQYLRE
jgi:dipeptidyl aminopeptidase/acylaminoacyl peptidase